MPPLLNLQRATLSTCQCRPPAHPPSGFRDLSLQIPIPRKFLPLSLLTEEKENGDVHQLYDF
jgi:hypothetical protein